MAEPTGIDTDPVARAWQSMCQIGATKLLVGIAIFLNIFQIFQFHSHRQSQQDFAHYYVSSKLWLEGEQVYGVDLTPHYESHGWNALEEPVDRATNPPGLVALFAPLAMLNASVAHTAWMLVQILAAVSACWCVWGCVKGTISLDGFRLILAIYLLLPFLKVHFFYSQVQLLLMAMVFCAWRLTLAANESKFGSRTRGMIACVIVVLATLIKVYPLVLLPWFVWRSDRQMTGRIAAGIVAGVALAIGVWLTDISMWLNFIDYGLATVSMWMKISHECFTISNTLHQFGSLVTGDVTSDVLVRVGSYIGIAILAVFYLTLVFRSAKPQRDVLNVELALLILLMLFCGATCWWHYLVFLLFPFQVIASKLKDAPVFFSIASFAIVVLLFGKIDFPSANIEFLERLLNQRPLLAMMLMAAFLAFKLKSNEHLAVADR